MSGRFIISLDCEGKWGMAENLTPHHHQFLTRENLKAAYERLIALFARHEVPATFAFVSCFTLSEAERAEVGDRLSDVTVEGENWLRLFRAAEASGDTDGWFCPEAVDLVQSRPEHEIACHGFCHAPMKETGIARADARRELESTWMVAEMKGFDLRTYVFPRNLIGYLDELGASGFKGYRDAPKQPEGKAGRVGNLVAELNVFSNALPAAPPKSDMIAIPSAYFLNWRRGIRAAIPPAVTRRRWRHILADAARNGRTAHLFLHPHNIIDAPGTYHLLDDIVAEAARLRSAGHIEIVTQAGYCAATQ